MKLQEGDVVRFLNEAMEGTVRRLLSNGRVEVSTADGFVLTANEQDLVRVEFDLREGVTAPPEAAQRAVATEMKDEQPAVQPAARPQRILDAMENDETVYAAIVLLDELSPLTTDFELHLLNNSGRSLAGTIGRKRGDEIESLAATVLPARGEMKIGVFSQDELAEADSFAFRLLFFMEGMYRPVPVLEKNLKVEAAQFLDNRIWEKAGGSGNRILLMPLKEFSDRKEADVEQLLKKYAAGRSPAPVRPPEGKPAKGKRTSASGLTLLRKEKVVDLHIEELLKDFSGLSNAQIIAHQIRCFQQEMDQAVLQKLHKITFIHGVGQGVLKSAIREELKKYDGIVFGDGPPEKYGYGATEVVLG
jgi:hypothetical protein